MKKWDVGTNSQERRKNLRITFAPLGDEHERASIETRGGAEPHSLSLRRRTGNKRR